MWLTDAVATKDFSGSGAPAKQALYGILYTDSGSGTVYFQSDSPFGISWVIKEEGTGSSFKVKATSSDQSPGYLSDKVDGVTLKINTQTNKIYIPPEIVGEWVINEVPVGDIDGYNNEYQVAYRYRENTLMVFYGSGLQSPALFTQYPKIPKFVLSFNPEPGMRLLVSYIKA